MFGESANESLAVKPLSSGTTGLFDAGMGKG